MKLSPTEMTVEIDGWLHRWRLSLIHQRLNNELAFVLAGLTAPSTAPAIPASSIPVRNLRQRLEAKQE